MLGPREVGLLVIQGLTCSLSVAMLKEETRGKKLDSEISLFLSPLFFFLSYLVIRGETRGVGGINDEKNKNP